MIEDRNKTTLTKAVTQAALVYLDERGCKPIETEVPVSCGWVADLATVLSPTMTDLINLKLVKRRDWDTSEEARKLQRLMTVLVEVKTSRSDFCGDRKWVAPPPANLCYLAVPDTLTIKPEEFPVGWGVLEYYSTKRGFPYVRCVRVPAVREVTVEQQLNVVLAVALRRDNNTRYEYMNKMRREIRENQNADISRTRVIRAMQAMASIVRGEHGSVQNALEYHGIGHPHVGHLPEYYIKTLETLWAIVPPAETPDAT